MTKLSNIYSQHHTTDDTTSLDYDYSFEVEDSYAPTHYDLPLIPILNDNDTSVYTISKPDDTTTIELDEYSFRESNRPEISTDSSNLPATTVSTTFDELIDDSNRISIDNEVGKQSGNIRSNETALLVEQDVADENSTFVSQNQNETRADDELIESDQNATATDRFTSLDQIDSTSPLTTTLLDLHDVSNWKEQSNEDDNFTTTSSELINKSESSAEEMIISDSTTIHLDDDFDTLLLNDSLLIDESSLEGNVTDLDYDLTTESREHRESGETHNYFASQEREENENVSDEAIIPTTEPIENRGNDEQNLELQNNVNEPHSVQVQSVSQAHENLESSNRFVYQHLPSTDKSYEEKSFVRFPEEPLRAQKQRVRFPDEPSVINLPTAYSWPRSVLRYWQEQPLVNDYFSNTRGLSGQGIKIP